MCCGNIYLSLGNLFYSPPSLGRIAEAIWGWNLVACIWEKWKINISLIHSMAHYFKSYSNISSPGCKAILFFVFVLGGGGLLLVFCGFYLLGYNNEDLHWHTGTCTNIFLIPLYNQSDSRVDYTIHSDSTTGCRREHAEHNKSTKVHKPWCGHNECRQHKDRQNHIEGIMHLSMSPASHGPPTPPARAIVGHWFDHH